jgi:thymidine kinase
VAKLYFRYGAVGSAKTLNLLAVAHSYCQQNKKVVLIKPELDIRFGKDTIKSRAGLEREADFLVSPNSTLPVDRFAGVNCVLVDEAQFLSISVVEQLRLIATELNIPVICYGLRTDFRSELFIGSKRLMELADAIEEVKTTCAFCNRKGIFNLKLVNGMATKSGPTIELGAEEKYLPTCAKCYNEHLKKIE